MTDIQSAYKLFKLHFPWMLDRIGIDFKYLKKNNWDLSYTLNQYWELFYYNSEIFDDDLEEKISELESSYYQLLSENLSADNLVCKLLNRLTIEIDSKLIIDKSKESTVKDIIESDNFDIFSPVYIVDVYKKHLKNNKDTCIEETEKELSDRIDCIEKLYRKFKTEISFLCKNYIFNMPIDLSKLIAYQKSHLRDIHRAILNICEKLIGQNVITFNYVIDSFISEKLNLFEIVTYDPEQSDNKKIIMI